MQKNLLRVLFPLLPLVPRGRVVRLPRKADSVGGWDEMQGYPEYGTSGYTSGDDDMVGLALGNMLARMNPAALMRGRAAPRRPSPPPPPRLSPGMAQGGQAGPGTLLAYMGLGTKTWASTDTSQDFLFDAEPQATFRGRRLVIAARYSTGAVGIAVVINKPLTVSGQPQTPAPDQDAPIEMFDPNATYSMLDLQLATSGTKITLGLHVSSIPVTGETVTVSAGLYGEWIR